MDTRKGVTRISTDDKFTVEELLDGWKYKHNSLKEDVRAACDKIIRRLDNALETLSANPPWIPATHERIVLSINTAKELLKKVKE